VNIIVNYCSMASNELRLTGRQGQLFASLTANTKRDFGKEARQLLTAVDVCHLWNLSVSSLNYIQLLK
jgi:hypothetical protein